MTTKQTQGGSNQSSSDSQKMRSGTPQERSQAASKLGQKGGQSRSGSKR